jgi:hypothetical protein
MTDWFKRNKVVMTHEWVIPTNPPWGANWTEVQQAMDAAREHWISMHPEETRIAAQDDRCIIVPDTAVRVKVGDDEVIVFYEDRLKEGTHSLVVGKSGSFNPAGTAARTFNAAIGDVGRAERAEWGEVPASTRRGTCEEDRDA